MKLLQGTTVENLEPVEKKRSRRDWVKNALIVFLAVMLLLTFFSNTIMNYSLPEVAAQYPVSAALVTKIRGSGVVEAAQSYDVVVEETRTVGKVHVKAGDPVKAGDVLVTLDEAESLELTEARAALRTLELEYEKMNVEKGDQTHAQSLALQQLREAVAQAEADLANAQNYESVLGWYQAQVASAQGTVSSRQQDVNYYNTQLQLLQNQKETVATTDQDYLNKAAAADEAQRQVDQLALEEPAYAEGGDAPLNQETGKDSPEAAQAPQVQESQAHRAWQVQMDAAKQTLAQTTGERDRTLKALTLAIDQQIAQVNEALINVQSAVTEAQTAVDAANSALSQFQAEYPAGASVEAAETALQTAREALANAEAAEADKAAAQAYEDGVADIERQAKARELEEAREKVAALEEKAGAAEITSRYDGVVQTVNIAAGDKTSPEQPLMVVELTERGYTLTASVTREQARNLRTGMPAEVTSLWNSDVQMTLATIKTDQANPAGNRTLTFAVKGEDVTVGQQLSFSIGDRNQSYDVVVPSSAVHADADGSFVYTIAVRRSPLGNRYSVQKTAVEVIASDDVNSALTGTLSTADFVVTTATVPLQPGDQVRIAE